MSEGEVQRSLRDEQRQAVDALAQVLSHRHGGWAGRALRRYVDAMGSPTKVALIVEADGLQQLTMVPPARMAAAVCGRCKHNAAAHEGTRDADRCHYAGCTCPGFHHEDV